MGTPLDLYKIAARLEALEAESNARAADGQRQMALFERTVPQTPAPDRLRELLDSVEPDGMSPREALDILYKLKQIADA